MSIKKELIQKAGGVCAGCREGFGRDLTLAQLAANDAHCLIDYKVPLKRGGNVDIGNAQVLCRPCYRGKNSQGLTDAEWRAQGCPQLRGLPRTSDFRTHRFR